MIPDRLAAARRADAGKFMVDGLGLSDPELTIMKKFRSKEGGKGLGRTLARASRDVTPTIVTRHGESGVEIASESRSAREAPKLTALRGSAHGCYGDAAQYVAHLRSEW